MAWTQRLAGSRPFELAVIVGAFGYGAVVFLLDDGRLVLSASDLTAAAACEFAVLRELDARLGRIQVERLARDPMRLIANESVGTV